MNKELTLPDASQVRYSVVRIIARLNVGGPAQHVLHLARELTRTYPTLVVTGDPEPDELEIPTVGDGIHIVRVKELGRSVRAINDLVALIKVWRILRKTRPRIVHTHTAKAGTIGRLAAVLAGVPIRVHTFHGHVFSGYFSPLVSRVVVAFERALARVTHCVVAISEKQARDLSEEFRVAPQEKIKVVPLGLDLESFRGVAGSNDSFRCETNTSNSALAVSIGRLAPVKNHKLLIEAAARLTDVNVRFAIVGGGSEEQRLRTLAAELGVADRVLFVGWRHDLPNVYSASDLVVLTSLNEGTPVCLIEALAAGVPVIASDVGGVSDLLNGGAYGTLFPSGDVEALAHAIRTVLNSPPLAHQAREASDYVMEKYSTVRLVRDVEKLYDELSASGGRQASTQLPLPSYQT